VKMFVALVGVAGLLALSNSASFAQGDQTQIKVAQRALCEVCQPFGKTCCALRPSIRECVKCGQGRYDPQMQRAWCTVHQPLCARKP
jgi:hypothetical protein